MKIKFHAENIRLLITDNNDQPVLDYNLGKVNIEANPEGIAQAGMQITQAIERAVEENEGKDHAEAVTNMINAAVEAAHKSTKQ